MNILLIEDEPIFRAGLKAVLAADPRLRVVGEAGSARSAFPLVDRLVPDVALIDITLPGMDGFAAAREIRRRSPKTKILMLTGRRSARDVVEAFNAGADGFAVKSEEAEVLLDAIHRVGRGERYVAPTLDPTARAVLVHERPMADVLSRLSAREREVFALLVSGLPNTRVARELCIARKTLDTHRHRIYEKLGCHSIAELVRFAAQNGLLAHGFDEVRALSARDEEPLPGGDPENRPS